MIEKILPFLEEGLSFLLFFFILYLLLKGLSGFGKYRMRKINEKQLREASKDFGFVGRFISVITNIISWLILLFLLIGVINAIFR